MGAQRWPRCHAGRRRCWRLWAGAERRWGSGLGGGGEWGGGGEGVGVGRVLLREQGAEGAPEILQAHSCHVSWGEDHCHWVTPGAGGRTTGATATATATASIVTAPTAATTITTATAAGTTATTSTAAITTLRLLLPLPPLLL